MLRGLRLLLILYCTGGWAQPPKPLLWQVSDEDNSIYLLGSFHMLKAEDYPLADVVNRVFDDADKVYFELSPDELNDPVLMQSVLKAGRIGDGSRLEQRVGPALWRRLQNYCATRGIPVETFQTMEPWLAALTITQIETVRAGYLPDLGLDKHYMEMAGIAGKPTAGLETVNRQFEAFRRMSEREQLFFLDQTLKDMRDTQQLHELYKRWRNGDAEGLLAQLRQDRVDHSPEFYRRLNSDRNRAWLPVMTAVLHNNRSGSALFVVGSLHLLGPEGLVELLKTQGFRIVRMQ